MIKTGQREGDSFMKHQLENTVTDTLNCLEENIFFIDLEYKIAWMNKAAEEFIESVNHILNWIKRKI
jgi:rsbT co-antagonist protein RsbR